MRSNTLISDRNTAIYEDFEDMFKNAGKRPEVIYNDLSTKYFLVPKTIAKIVYSEANKRGKQTE